MYVHACMRVCASVSVSVSVRVFESRGLFRVDKLSLLRTLNVTHACARGRSTSS